MNFDELDTRMRVFETAHDHCVLPGIWMVARIDGRGFTRLTREVHSFEAPFDERFRELMVTTSAHLMSCGFRMRYGYTQSDEISLLLNPLTGQTVAAQRRKILIEYELPMKDGYCEFIRRLLRDPREE